MEKQETSSNGLKSVVAVVFIHINSVLPLSDEGFIYCVCHIVANINLIPEKPGRRVGARRRGL